MTEYLERRAREQAFVQFLRLLRKTAMRDADHVSRTWFILTTEEIESAFRRGCSVDDVLDNMKRCAPTTDARERLIEIADEVTPARRPSAIDLASQRKGPWRRFLPW